MSRSNPDESNQLVNPASPFFEWIGKAGSGGGFKYYNKIAKENVTVKLPFTFLPLRAYVTLKGYNKKKDKSFWSNEVLNTKTDKITIRSKDGVEKEGLYSELKDFCELNKINYIQSLYIAYKGEDGKLKLGNFQIKTSALGPWIEFSNKNNVYKIAVKVSKCVEGTNGDVSFVSPVYESVKVSEETNAEAIKLDEIIAEYMELYFKKPAYVAAETSETKKEEPLPTIAEQRKAAAEPQKEQSRASVVYNPDDDDLPF